MGKVNTEITEELGFLRYVTGVVVVGFFLSFYIFETQKKLYDTWGSAPKSPLLEGGRCWEVKGVQTKPGPGWGDNWVKGKSSIIILFFAAY